MFPDICRVRYLLWAIVFASATLSAQTTEPLATEQLSTKPLAIEQLANETAWRRLGHYHDVGLVASRWQSQVDDPDFFLAAAGKHQPHVELLATVHAFYQPVSDANQHAICRYPARWYWLRAALSLPAPPLLPDQCPEYSQWLQEIKPHSVTLVFASSYLNSPSSMYGHTLLRVDPADIREGSDWLSHAVNFGAEFRPGENSLLYAYRGVFGGYPGFFSILRYQEKINEYNTIENRDLWEYHLNLTPSEVQQLMAHLWELRNIDFDYFFFDENCSFRLLELLEVARPGVQLTDGFAWRAIPLDTVRAVQDAGMVSDIGYRPSKSTQRQHTLDRLDARQQQLALVLAEGDVTPTTPGLTRHSPAEQSQILALAYQQVRAQQSERPRDPALAERSLALLQSLQALGKIESAPVLRPPSPDRGHLSLLGAAGVGRSDDTTVVDLEWRPSYHDLTDAWHGYLDGAAINMGAVHLRAREDDATLAIERFDLIDIRSHSPRNDFVSPLTWRVNSGMERVDSGTDDTLVSQVHGGAGVTYRVGSRHLCYGLGMARVEYNPLHVHNLSPAAGAVTGCLFYAGLATLQWETEGYRFLEAPSRLDHAFTYNQPLAKNHALRLTVRERQQFDIDRQEAVLSYRYFY